MLRQFGALPTEERSQAMKGRDYLWCLANILLDGEEALDRLCPDCRSRAMEEHCPVCGQSRRQWGEGMENAAFDPRRFEELKEGTL